MPLLLILSLLGWTPTTAQAETIGPLTVEYSTTTAPLILRAIAAKYDIDADSFIATAKCESQFNPRAFNRKDPNGGSRGVFQFQTSTFTLYAPQTGLQGADVWSPWDNVEVAAYMFSRGLQRQWSCFRSLSKL